LSFSLNKHVATGGGGLALTTVDAPAERRRGLRSLCFGKTRRFVREELGQNFCMSDLQAAVGAARAAAADHRTEAPDRWLIRAKIIVIGSCFVVRQTRDWSSLGSMIHR
jgi:dTDP-4-amino-4,6-dideoxygalactose transaminase